MGENNSSEIRVAPFGKFLENNHEMVNQLLHLIGCSRVDFGNFSNNDVFFTGNTENKKCKGEKSLKPPKEHLKSIIRLLYSNNDAMAYYKKAVDKSNPKGQNVKENRLMLAKREFDIDDVISAIDREEPWATLEGASKPDLFIESEKFILIVEGKLTEPSTTTSTTYLMVRNQMLRHIQGAIEYKRKNQIDKKIIAFYIVPETFSQIDEIKDRTKFREVLSLESVQIADEEYKQEIESCYYGCTTWEKIEKKFGIKFRAVIE